MSINNPPKYRYALFDPWDKQAFELIKKIAKNKSFPKIIGSTEDKNKFLIVLIRTQKALHGWRNFLVDLLNQIKQTNAIETKKLIAKYPARAISKKVPGWVTYKEDRIVSDFIDELGTRKIEFIGSDKEKSEFVMRFILGQLGHDWEQTILMIWEMLGEKNKLNVRKLNLEMENFDYLKFFN